MEFIGTLTALQKWQGLTDKEMADRIGCSRQLYQMTRTGKVPVGLTILRGSVAAFPELQEMAAVYFLRTNADIQTKIPDVSTTPAQMPQNRFSAIFRRLYSFCYYQWKSWFCYPKANPKLNGKSDQATK